MAQNHRCCHTRSRRGTQRNRGPTREASAWAFLRWRPSSHVLKQPATATMSTPMRYRPAPSYTDLGEGFFDAVRPARFPMHRARFKNLRWAERVGLGELTESQWEDHFARFEPLPGNLTEPLALRYHGHQFGVYNPDLGDGRGFLFAQLRDADGRLLDLGTKGSGKTPWSRGGDGR